MVIGGRGLGFSRVVGDQYPKSRREMGRSGLAAQLGRWLPDMKAFFMSGYADEAMVHHRVLSEVIPLFQKSFAPDLPARRVREVLEGR
jgi:hypothetical protein